MKESASSRANNVVIPGPTSTLRGKCIDISCRSYCSVAHQPLLVPENYSGCRFVWFQYIRSLSFSFLTIHASDRQMDGQTDRIATAIPCVALHAAR